MTPNSPGPFFVRINYQSQYAPHSMEIPCLDAEQDIGDVSHWHFLHVGGDTTDVTTDIKAFIDLVKVFFHAHVKFTDFVLFSQPDPAGVATPVFTDAIDKEGTNPDTSWDKAVQKTWSFRSNEFGQFKLVWLDCASFNNFDKVTSLTAGSADDVLRDYVVNNDSWLLARDGGQPKTFLQFAVTLNEKLRRSYRMN
jgi:hypothetical protein